MRSSKGSESRPAHAPKPSTPQASSPSRGRSRRPPEPAASRPGHEARCDLAIALEVRVERHGAAPIDAHAANLSTSGLGLQLGEPLQVGAAVLLRIALPAGSEPVVARGRVTWCEEPRPGEEARVLEAGVRLEVIADADRARLEHFVRSCERRDAAAS
jgi:hypothetical protein